ncbi:unnamed protein product [Caenorhabditis sp. 36 PRJEB53466]|nr:unnamed protein product [Caenorhabditis sp. 36 PRJEB53466]
MDGHNEVQSTSREPEHLNDRIPTHFLVELTSLDELAFPANSTKRVKYTCVASTSKSLCLGTSTGSVYIFSRYAAKSRSRANSPVPVQVFTTRDGQISTISVSASEELMAIGGDSGRVSVAQMNNGQPPTLLYSTPGDARAPDRVTALAWAPDFKAVFSGHASGALHVHRLTNRSVFRAAHQCLHKFSAEIVQLDTHQQNVLVATSLAAHVFHVESAALQQVGKKARSSTAHLGAAYVAPLDGGSAFIVAARPNGRLWESNLVGVVYRTHQYRQFAHVPRAPPVSFRSQFPTDPSQFDGIHPENQDVTLNRIHVLHVDAARLLIVSAFGSRICVVDSDESRVVCVAELEHDILDVSTCGNDVFVLLADSKGLRKFSVFDRVKTVEKLNLKHFFMQSAQTVLFCTSTPTSSSPPTHSNSLFPSELIARIVEGLATMSKKKETERLQQELQKILDERKAQQSMYDNLTRETKEERQREPVSRQLPSGVHRVLQTGQCSGYDDDFSFATPQALRERSRSSPCGPESPLSPLSPNSITKRASEPSSLEIRQEWRKNGTPDVVEEDILHRARLILDSSPDAAKIIEKESLRTLLQLEGVKRDEIRFTPTVTIGNAAKALAELALAVPVDLSAIWNDPNTRDGPETTTKKATIVKVIRPGVRPISQKRKEKPVATVCPMEDDVEANNVAPEQISEEMRRKQDEMWLDLRLSHIKNKASLSEHSEEAVPKSDTDYTLTTESGEPTPSRDEIWTNPLDEESLTPTQPPSEDPSTASTVPGDSFSCSVCGMHRSWAAASILTAVCGAADVLRDEFADGGAIPATMNDWQRLLRHVAAEKREKEVSAMCPRCEMSLSSVERVCNDGWRSSVGGIVDEECRPNRERIFERCLNTSTEKLRAIVSRASESTENGRKEAAKPAVVVRNEKEPETDGKADELPARLWNWTKAANLRTMLALAVFCVGKKSVLQIIGSDDRWIARRMKPIDWCAIVVMGARETHFKDLLASKTISSVLESVGASGWVMARKSPPTPSKSSRRISPTSSANSVPISNWIVDTNGKCPICTLSIKLIVGGQDRGVVSYCCGHVYHKVCLAGRHSIGCLACRVRARRAAAARSTTSSAAPSPIGSPIASPRHQNYVKS